MDQMILFVLRQTNNLSCIKNPLSTAEGFYFFLNPYLFAYCQSRHVAMYHSLTNHPTGVNYAYFQPRLTVSQSCSKAPEHKKYVLRLNALLLQTIFNAIINISLNRSTYFSR